ncbi:MAG: hypothetical protein U5O39_16785 [Gammaproteobacteria bacterium]|nr:hypothetical protein [Gammaproteobacteria bacterium]
MVEYRGTTAASGRDATPASRKSRSNVNELSRGHDYAFRWTTGASAPEDDLAGLRRAAPSAAANYTVADQCRSTTGETARRPHRRRGQ